MHLTRVPLLRPSLQYLPGTRHTTDAVLPARTAEVPRRLPPRSASTIVGNDPYNPSAILQKGGPGASAKKWPERCTSVAPFAAVMRRLRDTVLGPGTPRREPCAAPDCERRRVGKMPVPQTYEAE
jgi:hypothetical protein